ncbi:MAG TPA: hypothetical protein VKP30_24250, partial [Polyangiaceae bacterium]|nr:hypothetical protein [Polyangiaceae bacterium]
STCINVGHLGSALRWHERGHRAARRSRGDACELPWAGCQTALHDTANALDFHENGVATLLRGEWIRTVRRRISALPVAATQLLNRTVERS